MESIRDKDVFYLRLEARSALLNGVHIVNSMEGYSGEGYVSGFQNDGDSVTFRCLIEESKHYQLTLLAAVSRGDGAKYNDLYLDGNKIGEVYTGDSGLFETCVNPRVYLSAGEHLISIVRGWGDIHVDALVLEEAPVFDLGRLVVSPKLINPNATDNTKRLMKFLCDMYGKKIITGQQRGFQQSAEIDAIYQMTGKYPALQGFDFMDYSLSRVKFGSKSNDVEAAVDWWKTGGIVTFCWHWNAPTDLLNEAPDKLWNSGFYTRATTFDLEHAMEDPSSEAYELILKDIDAISLQLLRLKKEGIPVLWRPLHEASGAWFWWGARGAEPFKKLWKLMYDRMTNIHELNHLIWVWNGQHPDWYPGDEYVDIIGEDIYGGKRAYSSQIGRFCNALTYTKSNKIITLSENGTIPDPDFLVRDSAVWSWFCTWYGDFVWTERNRKRIYSEEYTELSMLIKVFKHELSITRDSLPDLTTYSLY